MARGKWNTSFRDKAKAQYQADQTAAAIAATNDQVRQEAWQAGYAAGYQAGRDSVLGSQQPPRP
jgi:flagellar biosynthesis/type III secretory pathway protein FliH